MSQWKSTVTSLICLPQKTKKKKKKKKYYVFITGFYFHANGFLCGRVKIELKSQIIYKVYYIGSNKIIYKVYYIGSDKMTTGNEQNVVGITQNHMCNG